MIREIASIDVRHGDEAAFETGVEKALPLFMAAEGCLGVRLERGIERPSHYLLVVEWRTVEDHTIGFRQSPAFAEWRALVGDYFAKPPEVEHVRQVELSAAGTPQT